MNCASASAIFASASAIARRTSGASKPRTRKYVRRKVIANQPSGVRSSAARNGCPRTPFMSRRRSEGGKVKYALGQDLFAPHTGTMADKFGVGWIIDVPDLSRVDRGGGAGNG